MECPEAEEDFLQAYADELELLSEIQYTQEKETRFRRKSQRSLDFSSFCEPGPSWRNSGFGRGGVTLLDASQESSSKGRSVKHTVDDLFGDIADIEEEDAIEGEQQGVVSPKPWYSGSSGISEPRPSQKSTDIGSRAVRRRGRIEGPTSGGNFLKHALNAMFLAKARESVEGEQQGIVSPKPWYSGSSGISEPRPSQKSTDIGSRAVRRRGRIEGPTSGGNFLKHALNAMFLARAREPVKDSQDLDFSIFFGPGPSWQKSGFDREGATEKESSSKGRSVKHTVDDLFGDIADIEEEDAIEGEQQGIVSPKPRCNSGSSGISEPRPSHKSTDIGSRAVKHPDLNQGSSSGGNFLQHASNAMFLAKAHDPVKANRKKKYSEMTKQERDEDLTARILHFRNAAKRAKLDVMDKQKKERSKGRITRTMPPWPFVTVVNGQNETLYVELKSEEDFEAEVRKAVSRKNKIGGLLSEPFSVVKAEALEYSKKQEERAALEASAPSKAVMEVDSQNASYSTKLWVEKYKPTCYMELLSNETSNRTLLKWLKLWDKVVFNRECIQRPNRRMKYSRINILDDELDKNNCPKQKIALLHGAPGTGKTTMAHLLARHAGYNPVEMNASDDRSPEAFRIQLEASTQMKSVLGKFSQPNCLILDEIDGAPAASIELLVKFVMGQDTGGKTKKGKKIKKATILKRPIICICNDLYVPALRSLRQIAIVIQLPQVPTTRIAKRLRFIADQEAVEIDEHAIMTLAEKANHDIRFCLSTLQFLKTCKKQITATDIKTNIAQKDIHKGLFKVWKDIFEIPKPKWDETKKGSAEYALQSLANRRNMPEEVRAKNILLSVKSCGDYERLVQGVFENYPKNNYWDIRMQSTCEALEWFCTMDCMIHNMHTTQNYAALAYIPYAFVKWHFLFGNIYTPSVKFPKADYEASVKKSRGKQVLKQLVSGMPPRARLYNNQRTLILETLPLLLHILTPNLPSITVLLYSEWQKKEMDRVVNIMVANNLQFIQQRNEAGDYDYVLDPNLETLVRFPHSAYAEPPPTLSYIVKQILARQIHFTLIRLNERVPSPQPEIEAPSTSSKKLKAKSTRTKKSRGKAKSEAPSMPLLTDFFQPEPEDPKKAVNLRQPDQKLRKRKARWFQFKEGFTNAVRKPLKLPRLWEAEETPAERQ